MKEIIVASTNEGKIKEIKAMLSEIVIDVKSIKDVFDKDIDIMKMDKRLEKML